MPNLDAKFEWTDMDQRAVDYARVIAVDAVEKVGSGHPGTAMSLAPGAYTLFQKVMRHDPTEDRWMGRDRFILSPGHTSLTLYLQLFLNGYGLEMKDLEALRTYDSLTPGHPEYGHTKGVEITTGPLGQGPKLPRALHLLTTLSSLSPPKVIFRRVLLLRLARWLVTSSWVIWS